MINSTFEEYAFCIERAARLCELALHDEHAALARGDLLDAADAAHEAVGFSAIAFNLAQHAQAARHG